MNTLRGAVAVVVAYLIMAAVSMGLVSSLFGGTEQPTTQQSAFALIALGVGSLIAGVIFTLIVRTANHPAIYVTLGVLIAMAARGYFMGEGIEPNWYRLLGTIAQGIGFMIGASMGAYRTER